MRFNRLYRGLGKTAILILRMNAEPMDHIEFRVCMRPVAPCIFIITQRIQDIGTHELSINVPHEQFFVFDVLEKNRKTWLFNIPLLDVVAF